MESAVLKSKIEAILFITSKAMQPIEIAELLGIEEEVAQEALLDLMFDYASRDGALEIDDEDGYIIQVKAEHLENVLSPIEVMPSLISTFFIKCLYENQGTLLLDM